MRVQKPPSRRWLRASALPSARHATVVDYDNRGGAFQATSHLLAEQRHDGHLTAPRAHSLRYEEDLDLSGLYTRASGYRRVRDVPYAADLTPALTTVRVPYEELGRTAVRLALDREDTIRATITWS